MRYAYEAGTALFLDMIASPSPPGQSLLPHGRRLTVSPACGDISHQHRCLLHALLSLIACAVVPCRR